jgi:hypothetical protein
MAQTNNDGVRVSRKARIGLGILGLVIVYLSAGPPDFAAFMIFSGWSNELDGGAHYLHIVLRGAGSVLSVALGVILIVRPQWAIGVALATLGTGIAYPLAGAAGLYFWPPVAIYPIITVVVLAAIYFAVRGQMPWQKPASERPVPSRAILLMTAILAVPLVIYSLDQAALQRGPEIIHGDLGHWAGAFAYGMKIIFLGLFASLKWPGWRVPAWGAAFSLFMLGLTSLLMPNQASSVGELWGTLAILTSFAFVSVAELEGRLFPRAAVQPAA